MFFLSFLDSHMNHISEVQGHREFPFGNSREFPGIRHFKNSRREFPGISAFLAKKI